MSFSLLPLVVHLAARSCHLETNLHHIVPAKLCLLSCSCRSPFQPTQIRLKYVIFIHRSERTNKQKNSRYKNYILMKVHNRFDSLYNLLHGHITFHICKYESTCMRYRFPTNICSRHRRKKKCLGATANRFLTSARLANIYVPTTQMSDGSLGAPVCHRRLGPGGGGVRGGGVGRRCSPG